MESVVTKLTQAPPRRLKLIQVIAFVIVLGVIALFAVGIRMRGIKPVESGLAPQFTIPTFSHGTFSLAEQRGQVVVVNFWASWCIPCRQEAAMLERVYKKYKDRGVVFIGVDYVDTDTKALEFIDEFKITYPNGPDIGTEAAQKFHIKGIPETYFVGKDGMLYGNYIGPFGSELTLTSKIEELLNK
ncbi:MAG: TlpA family protein disulfide reductase [Chloroflexi bacterium]|nr:TlpA family protein disulfide reductase [Chloroflexota bacterium]